MEQRPRWARLLKLPERLWAANLLCRWGSRRWLPFRKPSLSKLFRLVWASLHLWRELRAFTSLPLFPRVLASSQWWASKPLPWQLGDRFLRPRLSRRRWCSSRLRASSLSLGSNSIRRPSNLRSGSSSNRSWSSSSNSR